MFSLCTHCRCLFDSLEVLLHIVQRALTGLLLCEDDVGVQQAACDAVGHTGDAIRLPRLKEHSSTV